MPIDERLGGPLPAIMAGFLAGFAGGAFSVCMTDPASFPSVVPPLLEGLAQPFPLRWADVSAGAPLPRSWVARVDFDEVPVVLPEKYGPLSLKFLHRADGLIPIHYGPEASRAVREPPAGFVTAFAWTQVHREGGEANIIHVRGYLTEPGRIRVLARNTDERVVFRLEPVISRVWTGRGFVDEVVRFTLRCL